MLVQTVAPTAIVGTILLLALFLSITAHIAARNVLGNVNPRRAIYVGPLPAVVGVAGGALALPAYILLPVAIVIDGFMFRWSYEQPIHVVITMTVIHVVVTVLIAVVFGGIAALLSTRPG